MHVCTYVCMHVRVYACMYVFTHSKTWIVSTYPQGKGKYVRRYSLSEVRTYLLSNVLSVVLHEDRAMSTY